MVKLLARMDLVIGDREYVLLCDQSSPISEVRQALSQFQANCDAIEEAAKAALPPKEEQVIEDAVVVEPQVE